MQLRSDDCTNRYSDQRKASRKRKRAEKRLTTESDGRKWHVIISLSSKIEQIISTHCLHPLSNIVTEKFYQVVFSKVAKCCGGWITTHIMFTIAFF